MEMFYSFTIPSGDLSDACYCFVYCARSSLPVAIRQMPRKIGDFQTSHITVSETELASSAFLCRREEAIDDRLWGWFI